MPAGPRPDPDAARPAPGATVVDDEETGTGPEGGANGGATAPGARPGRRRERVLDLTAIGIVLVGFALPLRGLLHYQGPPMEEGFMLAFPQRFLAGDVPNKDFLHLYGPGSIWALAAVYKVFGATLTTERLVGLAQHLGIVFGVFALARPWGRRLATACALFSLVIIIGSIGLTALAWNGAVAFGVCGLAVGLHGRRRVLGGDERGGGRLLVVAGVLGGCALLYRPDLVVAVTLGYGALAWGLGRPQLTRLLGALAATGALIMVQVAMAGPRDAITGMVIDPVFHLRGGRSLPIPPSWSHFDGWLQKAAGLRQSTWPLPSPARPSQVFIWFFLLPAVALGVAGVGIWAARRRPAEWRSRVLLAAGLFGVGMMPQAFQRPDTAHLAWVSCVPLALAPVALTEVLRGRWPKLSVGWAGAVSSLLVAALLVFVIPFQTVRLYADLVGQTFGHDVFGARMHRGDRDFYYGSADAAAAAQRLIDDLSARSKPGERLLVGPVDLRQTPYSDAFFYNLFPELPPATRYIEMDPGMADAPDSGLADEVASADWLVLSNVWSGWDEPNDSRLEGPNTPNEVVKRDFCKVQDYRQGPDDRLWFQLWHRCRGS